MKEQLQISEMHVFKEGATQHIMSDLQRWQPVVGSTCWRGASMTSKVEIEPKLPRRTDCRRQSYPLRHHAKDGHLASLSDPPDLRAFFILRNDSPRTSVLDRIVGHAGRRSTLGRRIVGNASGLGEKAVLVSEGSGSRCSVVVWR